MLQSHCIFNFEEIVNYNSLCYWIILITHVLGSGSIVYEASTLPPSHHGWMRERLLYGVMKCKGKLLIYWYDFFGTLSMNDLSSQLLFFTIFPVHVWVSFPFNLCESDCLLLGQLLLLLKYFPRITTNSLRILAGLGNPMSASIIQFCLSIPNSSPWYWRVIAIAHLMDILTSKTQPQWNKFSRMLSKHHNHFQNLKSYPSKFDTIC